MKYLLWGGGRQFHLILGTAVWKEDAECVGMIQTKKTRSDVEVLSKRVPVYAPSDLDGVYYDSIIIANSFYQEVLSTARDVGIGPERIIIPYMTGDESKYSLAMKFSDYCWNPIEVIDVLTSDCLSALAYQMRYDLTEYTLFNDIRAIKENGFVPSVGMRSEYGRMRTIELLTQEIKEKHIGGAMAEVGVLSGNFAKLMRHCFPERDIYLYDTFEGFDIRDTTDELKNGNVTESFLQLFSNTSVDFVKSVVGDDEKCHYRVGYFPETVRDQEKDESFCLVSLDADLYNPTLAGLEFFYPRLAKGGYIMIHEYNVRMLVDDDQIIDFAGIRKAVRDFEAKFGAVCCVPITDRNGTLIITK